MEAFYATWKGVIENMDAKTVHMATFLLVILGALNWGLVGLLNFNVVESVVGGVSGLTQLVYVLVGASAVYVFATHKGDCKICGKK